MPSRWGWRCASAGDRLSGVRIDSGDLSWLAKMARSMLDEAGLDDCGIVLSNDLDEYAIQSIRDEGAQVTSWGVGTKLACAYDQPTLGGVYKLSATRAPGEDAWCDRLKISESVAKLTTPGVLDVRRYFHDDGRLAGDMVFDIHAGATSAKLLSIRWTTCARSGLRASASRRCSNLLRVPALPCSMSICATHWRPATVLGRVLPPSTRARSACSTRIRTRWGSNMVFLSAVAIWWRGCAASRSLIADTAVGPHIGAAAVFMRTCRPSAGSG